MKHFTTFIFVLIALMSIVMVSFAETTIDPETDTVFTCDSNPADFNGKTFEDLYVLLNGCKNLDSTVIPGDDAFLTLRDITVTNLHYTDDTYDAETGVYRESQPGEQLTYADHYLNIAGNSEIRNAEISCLNPHVCNFGVQYPIMIGMLYVYPTNATTRGKIVLRGYIDPLVDPETDYYNDSVVKSYPEFNLETFDNDRASLTWSERDLLTGVARYLNQYYLEHGAESARKELDGMIEYGSESDDPDDLELDAALIASQRGGALHMVVLNKYAQNIGDTVIDFDNFYSHFTYLANAKSLGNEDFDDIYDLKWTPVLRAGGYSNIGVLSAYSSFKTDIVYNAPYTPYAADYNKLSHPMSIDAVIVGTQGRKVQADISFTKIVMFNYLGGFDPDSKLEIHWGRYDNIHVPAITSSIGLLTVHGGNVSLIADKADLNYCTVGNLMVFAAREDFTYPARSSDRNNAKDVFSFRDYQEMFYLPRTEEEVNDYNRLGRKFSEIFNGNLLSHTNICERSPWGYNWILSVLDKYIELPDESVKTAPNTRIHNGNMNFGEIAMDESLDEWNNPDVFTASCQIHQYGQNEEIVTDIITR